VLLHSTVTAREKPCLQSLPHAVRCGCRAAGPRALRHAPAGSARGTRALWRRRARRAPRLEVHEVNELVGLRDRARGLALRLGGLAALLVRNHGREAAAALLQPHRLHARVARRQHLRGRGRAREALGARTCERCGRRARAARRACAAPGAGRTGAGREGVSGVLQGRRAAPVLPGMMAGTRDQNGRCSPRLGAPASRRVTAIRSAVSPTASPVSPKRKVWPTAPVSLRKTLWPQSPGRRARACRQVTMRSTESASAGCGSAALSPSSSMAAMASMPSALARLAACAPAPGSSRIRSSSFVSAPARAAAASARKPAECEARPARTCTACWAQRLVLLQHTVAGPADGSAAPHPGTRGRRTEPHEGRAIPDPNHTP